ncbi:ABC transporter substrate-binding protein [Patulibacter sp. NPDC049589]|uniref:ABC transporter substrate-binding protein n=1 Tax=Patulibacter sp. NPDC049589 TaxID=3154731 RepID=UPI003417B5D0
MDARRTGMAALATVAVIGTLAGCGGSDGGSSGGGGGGDGAPLKIALVTPGSGALAVFGKDAARGWQLAADEVNAKGGVDGHKVQLIQSDTDGTPPKTVAAVRKAVSQDGAHYVSAVFTSPENGAIQAQLKGLNAISINAIAQDETLNGKGCVANAFRLVQSAPMNSKAIGAALPKLPAKKWAILAADYNTGRGAAAGFKQAVEASGGSVVSEQFSPLGTTEYGSYIAKLKKSGADGLFMYVIGSDAPAFINQGTQFKLFDQFKTVLGQNVVSEPLFKAIGDQAVGFYNNLGYTWSLPTPRNQAFVKAYEAKFGAKPYYVPADNYVGALALFDAVRKAKSVEPAAVQKALSGLTFESLDGQATIRPGDNQVLRKNYVGQVVKKDGKIGWKIVSESGPEVTTPQADPSCKL